MEGVLCTPDPRPFPPMQSPPPVAGPRPQTVANRAATAAAVISAFRGIQASVAMGDEGRSGEGNGGDEEEYDEAAMKFGDLDADGEEDPDAMEGVETVVESVMKGSMESPE